MKHYLTVHTLKNNAVKFEILNFTNASEEMHDVDYETAILVLHELEQNDDSLTALKINHEKQEAYLDMVCL